jgi:hypothetical protein
MANDNESPVRSAAIQEVCDRLEPIRAGTEPPDPAKLFALFDRLPAVRVDDMIGDWQGELISRGHPAEARLHAMQWDGKRFLSANEVHPIISRNEHGERVINGVLGAASLREVVFRGVATATMIYDNAPVFDHFRRLGDDRVLGVMDQKGSDQWLFFCLRRIG